MVIKLLVLTLITRAKIYKKLITSAGQSRPNESKSWSKSSVSGEKYIQKAEKILTQAISLVKKYIPDQGYLLQVIQKELDTLKPSSGVVDRRARRGSQFSEREMEISPEFAEQNRKRAERSANYNYQSFGNYGDMHNQNNDQNKYRRKDSQIGRADRPFSVNYMNRNNKLKQKTNPNLTEEYESESNLVLDSSFNEFRGSKNDLNQSKRFRIGRSKSSSRKIQRNQSSHNSLLENT